MAMSPVVVSTANFAKAWSCMVTCNVKHNIVKLRSHLNECHVTLYIVSRIHSTEWIFSVQVVYYACTYIHVHVCGMGIICARGSIAELKHTAW